jgi:hypothetical protein
LGWVYKPYLIQGSVAEATHLVIISSYGLRDQSDRDSEIVTRVMGGTGVRVEEVHGGWANIVANETGWMPLNFLRAMNEFPNSLEEKQDALLKDSTRMTGVPYLWGGMSGNGIDCSGLARLLHRWIGVDIPRDADMQCEASRPVEPPYEVGDLFFFAEDDDKRNISHVGMSLGGWDMIHSSRRNNGVYIDNLQEQTSLMSTFVSAGSFTRT